MLLRHFLSDARDISEEEKGGGEKERHHNTPWLDMFANEIEASLPREHDCRRGVVVGCTAKVWVGHRSLQLSF